MGVRTWILLVAVCFACSCRPTVYTPKPSGYFRLDTPAAHTYQVFDMPGYPFTFDYPTYCVIEKDTAFFREKADNPYWLNISFPSLGGMLNITYKAINSKETFDKMMSDSYYLTNYHNKKASYIDNTEFRNSSGVSGILYKVGGNAASRYQFIATDSTKHFLRGALYFNTTPNADSLLPANDFISADIERMLVSLKFR
ncbi:MAG: hypothetical protein H7257_11985 [Taibaiella sp.]|nr:hypothetical protein [Taibaiella sp.]